MRAERPSGRRRGLAAMLVVVAVIVSVSCRGSDPSTLERVSEDGTCLYSGHLIDRLDRFGDSVGRRIDCAVVFNNAAPTWPDLVAPWFVAHGDPNLNWAAWKRDAPGRLLIISQSLVPDDVPEDWRQRGAAGEYDEHARALAANLVAADLGDSIIRLSHEANGLWWKDGLGSDPSQYGDWRDMWRRFATAMRSVPGASFQFDWTINPGVRPIPFDDYYPGDDVVDIIGVDIYDYWETDRFGPATADLQRRWDIRFAEPGGAAALLEFADARGKPVSIPEWGLSVPGPQGGLGDEPTFVANIARLVRDHPVVYQAYFENSNEIFLSDSPRSLAAYRDAFGVPVTGGSAD